MILVRSFLWCFASVYVSSLICNPGEWGLLAVVSVRLPPRIGPLKPLIFLRLQFVFLVLEGSLWFISSWLWRTICVSWFGAWREASDWILGSLLLMARFSVPIEKQFWLNIYLIILIFLVCKNSTHGGDNPRFSGLVWECLWYVFSIIRKIYERSLF